MKNLILALFLAFAANAHAYNNGLDQISFNFDDIQIRSALTLLADYKDSNIIIDPSIVGSMSMNLNNVDWDSAFSYVKTFAGLDSEFRDGVLFVYPKDAKGFTNPFSADSLPLVSDYPLSIFKVSNVLPSGVIALFTARPNEFISADDNSSVIVAYLPDDRVQDLKKVISTVDYSRKQVVIEARIVEVNKDYAKNLGVDWSAELSSGDFLASGNTALSVGLTGSNAAMGFIGNTFALDARLNAMEQDGKGQVVSKPKVFAFDRKPASIIKGFEVPYQQAAGDRATSIAFKTAALALEVLPIVNGNQVTLDVTLSKDEPDFSRAYDGQPPINTASLTSNVRIISGSTVVLGGVYSTTQTDTLKKVPVLSRIPFLGKAFQSTSTKTTEVELLLFLTATVVE